MQHYNFVAAGLDYLPFGAPQQLNFDGVTSAMYSVSILSDDLTELTEFFEGILTGFSVSSPRIPTPLLLLDQERGRIQLSPDRAQVNILDVDGKIS